jgi:hypothetical protein
MVGAGSDCAEAVQITKKVAQAAKKFFINGGIFRIEIRAKCTPRL